MNKDMKYRIGISSVLMRIFDTSEVHHQYKIWCAGKAHHQIVKYTGLIFPAFDELYLPIISVFNTTGNVMNFLS